MRKLANYVKSFLEKFDKDQMKKELQELISLFEKEFPYSSKPKRRVEKGDILLFKGSSNYGILILELSENTAEVIPITRYHILADVSDFIIEDVKKIPWVVFMDRVYIIPKILLNKVFSLVSSMPGKVVDLIKAQLEAEEIDIGIKFKPIKLDILKIGSPYIISRGLPYLKEEDFRVELKNYIVTLMSKLKEIS